MTTIVIRPAAVRDLRDIGRYIARHAPERAISFTDELEQRCRDLGHQPERGRLVPQVGRDTRQLVHGSYLIFYRYDEQRDEVVVLRFVHGSRDLQKLRIDS